MSLIYFLSEAVLTGEAFFPVVPGLWLIVVAADSFASVIYILYRHHGIPSSSPVFYLEAVFQDYLRNVYNNKTRHLQISSQLFLLVEKNRCLRDDAILVRYENKPNMITLGIQQSTT